MGMGGCVYKLTSVAICRRRNILHLRSRNTDCKSRRVRYAVSLLLITASITVTMLVERKVVAGKAGQISRWQRAFCLLSALEVNPTDVHELCGDEYPDDEIGCVEEMYISKFGRKYPPCVSADFVDAQVQTAMLLKYRSEKLSRVTENVLVNNRVLITVCVKDESRLLLVSIIWHLLQGVDHYYICNNSPTNRVLEHVLHPLRRLSLITIVSYDGTAVQQQCFDDGLGFARVHGYHWQGGFDADEFLFMAEPFTTVQSMLNKFSTPESGEDVIAGLALNWIMQPSYGQLAVQYPTDQLVTPVEKLDFFLGTPNRHVKTFARVKYTSSWKHVHMPLMLHNRTASIVNTERERIRSIPEMFNTVPRIGVAAILHFNWRSAQELVAKRERGRATIDCESQKSLNNSVCAVVHKARLSDRKVSYIGREYASKASRDWDVPASLKSQFVALGTDAVLRDLSRAATHVLGGTV